MMTVMGMISGSTSSVVVEKSSVVVEKSSVVVEKSVREGPNACSAGTLRR
jgi:hypothetical protein